MSARAWLVDLDGTLYRALPVKLCMAGELVLCGGPAIQTLRAFREEHERLRGGSIDLLPSPWHVQLERTARRLALDPGALQQLTEEWMIVRPGRWIARFARRFLLAEIAAARARGIRTALVSDYPARAKLVALGATQLFDQVVANGEPGGPLRLKPAAAGYLLAAQRLGVEPEACLVIGDRKDADGLAASRANMRFRRVR